jgi:aminoglycoside phosphotransferase (APT) family kinase protein
VRPAHRLDEKLLAEWMVAHVDGFFGPMQVVKFKGGQSNPTYKIITRDQTYVLRRKPPGQLLKGAHAIDREAQVLSALSNASYPVPRVYAECSDGGVIGTPFYIMEMVEGRIFWDARFPDVSREDRPSYFDAMNKTLAQLHTIDYAAIELSGYGRPGRYCERQVARWSKQYLEDPNAGRDRNMDRVLDWLPGNVPKDECGSSLVHGDFRCDNMIFHATEPRVLAVLDWELSTLGDPLSDFAYHAMMYRMPPHIVAGLLGTSLKEWNIPSEEEYIAAYCKHTRRESVPHFQFYTVFNFFRLAAIFHGIKGRVIRGTASSAQAIDRVKVFPELAAIAWAQIARPN